MKKLMAICAATFMLACVATSCSKMCQCTVSYELLGTTYSETIKDIDLSGSTYNCSTYGDFLDDTYADYTNVKIDCKKQ
jgi:hypothetical protein